MSEKKKPHVKLPSPANEEKHPAPPTETLAPAEPAVGAKPGFPIVASARPPVAWPRLRPSFPADSRTPIRAWPLS